MQHKLLMIMILFGIFADSNAEKIQKIIKLKSSFTLNKSQESLLGDSLREVVRTSFGDFIVLDNMQDKSVLENLDIEYIVTNDDLFGLSNNELGADFPRQWGMDNTGKNNWYKGPMGFDMNVKKAWDYTKGDKNLVIAIIDSGVDYKHYDLKDNIWKNTAEINGKAGFDDDGNGTIDDFYGYDFVENDGYPMDLSGHGTLNAGIIAAKHNQRGIAGMMNNVKLMVLRTLNENNKGDTLFAIKAIDYAIKNKAKIVSASWGGGKYNQALYDAILKLKENGILLVCAAGNSRRDNDKSPLYPASYDLDNIVSVAAYDGRGKKASFSNFGLKSVDVFAPGKYINSTFPGNLVRYRSGTSVAAPFVTGALGLLYSINPKINYRTAKDKLIQSSVAVKAFKGLGQGGKVDTLGLLEL